MGWTNLARVTGAAAMAALLMAGCTGEADEAATPAADADGAVETSDATTAEETAPPVVAEEVAAEPSYIGFWRQTDDPDPSTLNLMEGGRVTTNEEGLPEGRWQETPAGNLVILFTDQQTVRITGEMNGDVLVLTLPDGEEGRFERSSETASAPAGGAEPSGQRPPWG